MEQLMYVQLGIVWGCNYPLNSTQLGLLEGLYPYSGWHYSLLKDGARMLLEEDLKLSEEEIKKVRFITNHDGHGNQWGILVYQDTIVGEFGHQERFFDHPLSEAHLEHSYVSQAYYRLDTLRKKRDMVYGVATIGASGVWIGSMLTSFLLGGPTFDITYIGAILVAATARLTYLFAFREKRFDEETELEYRKTIKSEFALA